MEIASIFIDLSQNLFKMSSLRSTEKSLTMLCFSASKILKPQRLTSTSKVSDVFNKKTQKRSFCGTTTASQTRRYVRQSRAKDYKLILGPTLREFTTSRVQNLQVKPLLNPEKSDIKDAIIQPIVPLTQPRFAKTGNVEAPSVTKILSVTMPAKSKFMLDKWKEGMIKKLGAAGFMQYQKDTFERGSVLHGMLARYLLGQGEPTEAGGDRTREIVANLWKSIQPVVCDKITNVRLVEHTVTYADMNYRGIVDCVGFYENELVVIDFKTSEKPKKTVESLFDNPIQVAAYCGAINNDPSIPNHVIDRNICSGLVIVAYCDGSPASTYYLDSDKVANTYWKEWVRRLTQYSMVTEMQKLETKETSKK